MGRGARAQLEPRGVDRARPAGRRQDRTPGRSRCRRAGGRRLDIHQSLQGPERRVGPRARHLTRAPRRTLRAQQLPHRPPTSLRLLRASADSTSCSSKKELLAQLDQACRCAAPHPRQLSHRPHARPRRDDRRRPRRRCRHGLGPGTLGRRRAGRSRRQRGRLRGRLRLQVPHRRAGSSGFRLGAPAASSASSSRSRAGSATPPRSTLRPATGPRRASPDSSAAPRRCFSWRRSNAASTPSSRPSRWAASRRCAPSRWRSPRASSPASRAVAPGWASSSSRRATAPFAAAGSSYRFTGDGYAVMQALAARGVIGDYRAGSAFPRRRSAARESALRLRAALQPARRDLGRRRAAAPGASPSPVA